MNDFGRFSTTAPDRTEPNLPHTLAIAHPPFKLSASSSLDFISLSSYFVLGN
jgi:hypothetical protein